MCQGDHRKHLFSKPRLSFTQGNPSRIDFQKRDFTVKKYNVVIPTELGAFIINKNDIGVGWQLAEYGDYDRFEMNILKGMLGILRKRRPDLVVLDVGANIGVHAVMFSREAGPKGKVYSFEAQRILFNMLAGNIALNSINNVYCFHNAVSDESKFIDIPQFDYSKPLNFGSVEFGREQEESIGQERMRDPDSQEQVLAITLDSCGFEHADLIKIDVEGMEMNVLRGAAELIRRAEPVMLIEYLKSDSREILAWLSDLGYCAYSGVGANFLCLPGALDAAMGGTIPGLTKMGSSSSS